MQNTTDSEDNQEGGAAWELSEAIRLMGEAQTSGDPDAIATAMRRHAEAMTNSVNATMIPTLKSVLESVVRKEVGALSNRLDNSDRARLDRNTSLQTQLDTRLDKFAQLQDTTLAAVREVAASVGKQEERIDTLTERMAEVESAIAARPEARAAEHRAIVDEIGGKLDTFGQEFAEFKVAFAVFNASLLLSDNAVVVIDLHQTITRANRKALDLFGYTTEELIGQPIDVLIPERFRERHRAHIEAFAQSSETQQLMADRQVVYGLHKDGHEFPIKAAISKVPDGFTAVVRRVP